MRLILVAGDRGKSNILLIIIFDWSAKFIVWVVVLGVLMYRERIRVILVCRLFF